MFYLLLSLSLLFILLSFSYVVWVLYHIRHPNRYSSTKVDIAMDNDVGHKSPAYEIPILISIDSSSDLDVVENLIYEVNFEVLNKRNERVNSKPDIKYRTFDETCIEFFVFLKVNSLSEKHSIKKEFIKLLRKRFYQNGVIIPYPNHTDLYLINN